MVKARTKLGGEKRLPIKISVEAYAALKAYSSMTGVSITRIISEMVPDWMETTGAVRLEVMMKRSINDSKL